MFPKVHIEKFKMHSKHKDWCSDARQNMAKTKTLRNMKEHADNMQLVHA